MDCLNNILIGASWLIEKLNQYHGLLLVILTIIGFWFIWKQIKIAKNKDMLILIHKDLNLYFEDFENKFNIFYKEIEEAIKSCLNNTQFSNYETNIKDEEKAGNYNKKLNDISKHLKQFHYESFSKKLIRIIEKYQWWFDLIQCKTPSFNYAQENHILESINEFINNIQINKLARIHKDGDIRENLFTELKKIEKKHKLNIENLRNQTNKILSDITKKSL